MTFEMTTNAEGERSYFVDGYEVLPRIFDTLLPSKMFPVDTGMSVEQAEAMLTIIKGTTPKPETHKGTRFSTAISEARPLKSQALAVHAKQIPAVLARNKKHGLGDLKYDRAGRPVFTSQGQRKRLMKLEKVVQCNSYYGA